MPDENNIPLRDDISEDFVMGLLAGLCIAVLFYFFHKIEESALHYIVNSFAAPKSLARLRAIHLADQKGGTDV